MMKPALLALLVLLPSFAFTQEYRYLQTIGKERSLQTVTIRPDASGGTLSVVIRDTGFDETHTFVLASDLSTLRWVYRYPDGNSAVFRRTGNGIRSEGHLGGKRSEAEAEIDQDPWYGIIGMGLGGFVRAGAPKTTFWTVNPDNGKAYKMTAKRRSAETIVCDGLTVQSVKVTVSVAGVPSAFYSTDYWFREDDGLLLRFEGTSRGLGSPKTVLELAMDPAP
jgi:hypothetical protein